MATIVAEDIYACEDCTLLIANGEFDDSPNGLTVDEVNELQIVLWGDDAGNMVIACVSNDDEDNPEGLTYDNTHLETIVKPIRCDTCGRMMHGEFHLAALIR